ncbi:hypothetical protein M5K25_010663 [Dendrobium thyrsiflorum]|uniref:NB-ARC domain-containing protein n=1 Tax=Dendrobium thyrsiflorum TaxID=117978 RepID=A0ABD0V858_DENTH
MVPSAASKVYEKMADAGSAVKPDSRREVVQKLDKVPVEVSIFLHLLESIKQEWQHELYKAHETGFLPRNNLISRGKDKEFVMQWLKKPLNEHSGIDLYRNISLLSVVGHGGMGKTTLLQHVYEDDMAEEFDLKMSMMDARRTFDRMPDRNIVDKLLERLMVDRVAYVKSCEFDAALRVFDEMPYHDIAIWNVLFSVYEQNKRPKEALAAFNELQDANVEPNQLTLVAALSACSQLGLAMHGRGKEALNSFKEMQEAEVKPSHVTFTNILSACSHAGLVEEGRMYSSQMLPLYGIAPDIEHNGCMVDILGRARCLEEAMVPRCKVFDPGGLIITFTSISLSIMCLDRVEFF